MRLKGGQSKNVAGPFPEVNRDSKGDSENPGARKSDYGWGYKPSLSWATKDAYQFPAESYDKMTGQGRKESPESVQARLEASAALQDAVGRKHIQILNDAGGRKSAGKYRG